MFAWKTWAAALAVPAVFAAAAAADGEIKGTVKIKVPAGWASPIIKVNKDGAECCRTAAGKPAETSPCAGKNEHADDSLIVDLKTGGLANAVVWLDKAPEGGKREWDFLKKLPDYEVNLLAKSVTADQKFCMFRPHILLIPKGWGVLLASQDNVAHNVHTLPFENDAINPVIPAAKLNADGTVAARSEMGPVTGKTDKSERAPGQIKVQCDIHPWMSGYWVIMEHPYYALTDAKGEFVLPQVPAGKYVVKVWHEKFGNKLAGPKGIEVEVKDGAATELTGLKEIEAPK